MGWGPFKDATINLASQPTRPLSSESGGTPAESPDVSGDSAETSLTVQDLTENIPYKFKVQARTTEGFGPEREGIITIESQDAGQLTRRSPGSASFLLPHSLTEAADPTDGMMMTTRHTEAGAMVTRQITRGVVQRSVTGAASVTRKMTYES
uniref:Fibronectin type-III domain-containing protein n=1 Tax=Oryzias melastigma TaxID=30732 RepID=A0A3B3BT21_ORYME